LELGLNILCTLLHLGQDSYATIQCSHADTKLNIPVIKREFFRILSLKEYLTECSLPSHIVSNVHLFLYNGMLHNASYKTIQCRITRKSSKADNLENMAIYKKP